MDAQTSKKTKNKNYCRGLAPTKERAAGVAPLQFFVVVF